MEGFPIHVLHDEVVNPVLFTDVVECADVRVVQAADSFGFALEPFTQISAVGKMFGKDLDGNGTVQTGVGGAIHLSHTARAQLIADLVRTESGSFRERHTAPRRVLSYPRKAG